MEEAPDILLRIARILISRKETVSVTETSTGGLISAELLSVPGASSYFVGGVIPYARSVRGDLLGITKDTVVGLSPMSEEMAMSFAQNTKQKMRTDWAIAELGIAGPGGSVYGFEPGSCVVGISGPCSSSAFIRTGKDRRNENMALFRNSALALFLDVLSEVQS